MNEEICFMAYELRRLEPDDADAVRRVVAIAFGQGRLPTIPDPHGDPTRAAADWIGTSFGVFEGGALRSHLKIQPFRVHWGAERRLDMGGIAAVATNPDARGKGYAEALLRRSLEDMRDRGQTVSALYPFAWAFYRRMGWDWVGEMRTVKLPLLPLAKAAETAAVSLLPPEGVKDRMIPGYEAYGRLFRGVHDAETHRWGCLRQDDDRENLVYLYEPTGEYLVWRYDSAESVGVREWVVWTPEGHRALLGLLRAISTQCATARLALPGNTPLPHFLMHWEMEVKTHPVYMGRVVDVAAALAIVPVASDCTGSLRLRLHDAQAPWNDGLFRVTIEAGAVTVESVIGGGGEADLEMDIAAFSQAFWGAPSLDALRDAGRLVINSDRAFSLLRKLLPAANVYTLDDF